MKKHKIILEVLPLSHVKITCTHFFVHSILQSVTYVATVINITYISDEFGKK